jgi:hypothetical protein
MPLQLSTAVKWTTLEDALERISKRNRTKRIIFDSLFIKVGGSDPLKCWDSNRRQFVYVTRADWLAASPAMTSLEVCKILRVTPGALKKRRDELGIKLKNGIPGRVEGVPTQAPQAYHSINDVIEIANSFVGHRNAGHIASEQEVRRLFTRGYTTYKLTKAGEFIPTWEETI